VSGLKIRRGFFQRNRKWILLLHFFASTHCITAYCADSDSLLFFVDAVRFQGLKRTRARIVHRELAICRGNGYFYSDTSALFRKSAQNIFNTRLFNFCRYRVDSLSTDPAGNLHGVVIFEVSERWYTFPYPVFELADRNFNEWWYDRNADLRRVNAGLRFLQKNVRGRNEDFIAGFQLGFTRRLDLAYVIPYLDKGQRLGLRFQASFASNKDVAVRTSANRLVFFRDEEGFGRERSLAGLQLSYRNNIYAYHYLDAAYCYNRITPFIFGKNEGYFAGRRFQRFADLRYTFVFDKRNFRFFATRGSRLRLLLIRSGILPADNFGIWAFRAEGAVYREVSPRLFWAFRLDGEVSSPADQPFLGSRFLGFENRFVRGYERYVLEGPANIHFRQSLRWRFFNRKFSIPRLPLVQFRYLPLDLYLSPFIDGGYVRNLSPDSGNNLLLNTPLLGYGLGIHAVSFYDIVIRVEYSRTRHGDQGLYLAFLTDI
jgi:outer membrane protein assembly factor BamA